MSEWTVDIDDKEIDAALEAAKDLPPRPIALSAEYNRDLDLVLLHIDNGRRLVIPREELQGLENATPEQLADIEIFAGVSIGWRQLDVDHYLPYLFEGRYSSERWRQSRQRREVAA
jgi:Protein of unknown function (DUF2442)